ncbi:MAG: hypothetical protein LWX56_10690 [Ignavibacteria bacterium]|nr:hypothetical protein [Ignavibacteria bacterium]
MTYSKYTRHIILTLTGIMFLISGFAKLFPISSFEFQLVLKGFASWLTAPWLSRFLIGTELFLGFSLLTQQKYYVWFTRAAIMLLTIFSIYLVLDIIYNGGDKNCGCFGEVIRMSSPAALLKNILSIIILVPLVTRRNSSGRVCMVLPAVGSAFITLLLILVIVPVKKYNSPVKSISPQAIAIEIPNTKVKTVTDRFIHPDTLHNRTRQEPQPAHSVFSRFTSFSTGNINLDEGKKVVALLSLDCEHCLKAAQILHESQKADKAFPIFALFLGEQSQVADFMKQSGLSCPYMILDAQDFFPLLTKSPPRVCVLWNGNVIRNIESEEFEPIQLPKKWPIN